MYICKIIKIKKNSTMKKFILLFVTIIYSTIIFSQITRPTQYNSGQNCLKYIHDAIPTAVIDTVGVSLDSILFQVGGYEFLDSRLTVYNYNSYSIDTL